MFNYSYPVIVELMATISFFTFTGNYSADKTHVR